MTTREQAIAAARVALDDALDRIARDRAAGRLTPHTVRAIDRAQRTRTAPRPHRAAA